MQRNQAELYLKNAAADVEKALADIEAEKTSNPDVLVSGHPSSQAILLAKKRQDRMREGKDFHAFILTQDSPGPTEFGAYIAQLKNTAKELKPGTRILLNVFTTYVDTEFDKDMYDQGRRECAHWTPVDLLVEADHSISSVILDASDTFGHRRMHSELKAMFPGKEHFIYRADTIDEGGRKKDRRIQTQKIGCRVFSIEHIKQLTQIKAEDLRSEVRAIADETGTYTAGAMKENSQLIRVLRGMQTVSGLNALSPAVRRSPFNDRKVTLEQSLVCTLEGRINMMVVRRSTEYKKKKSKYVNLLTSGELNMIMATKAGFSYLHYPVLFTLSETLTLASRESVDIMLKALQEKCEAQKIDSSIIGLTDAGLSNEALKSKLLFRLEASFLNFESQGKEDKCQQLSVLLKTAMPLLKASQRLPNMDYLSTDGLFATRPGRSSVPERYSVRSRTPSPTTPVATPTAPRIHVIRDDHESGKIQPPVLNFPN